MSDVFYKLEDTPPLKLLIILGIQHVLAMFVGLITPPIIIAATLGISTEDKAFLISMALIASGITTFMQVKRWGPLGSGLLGVQGTSFTFVPAAISTGLAGGIPLICGMTIAAAPVELLLSRFVKRAGKIFPPVVMGTVVMLIGLSLIRVGITDLVGGIGSEDFGSIHNILLGLFVLIIIIIINQFTNGILRVGAVGIGLLAGYIVSALLGSIDFSPISEAGWITIPVPLKYGIKFDFAYILPWIFAYLVSSIETMGDLTASAQNSGEKVDTPLHTERLSGGLVADALGSMLAGFLNSMPNTTFSQNNGVILVTKAGARRIGYAAGTILIILGLVPKFSAIISVMPRSVLGGATIALFGFVAISGLKIIMSQGLTDRNLFILSISLALGLGIIYEPSVLDQLPETLKKIFSSGMVTGGMTSVILNLVIPEDRS
ncbi:MAG: purine permease [Candidatus Muiribacterium halophilum]|uniref:Purine permease n=1 Tax=Muiribacterium halophilum TaxID=2053465 RepID=A0A2N5ZAB0_MUIH1|nr:MAG: purine permease [Candidatus Muirbacterium halophilum]